MSVLVTGCAGFIGSHVAERLLTDGHIVYGIDNINDYYDIEQKHKNLDILNKYDKFTFYKEDIVDTCLINKLKPQYVCHLAAMAGVRYSLQHPKLYAKVNIEGFINLLEQSVSNIKHFVYASSSSVYGLNEKIPFSETDDINTCNSSYACSKKCKEIYAKYYNQIYDISITGLRFFTVYGPRGRPDMAPYKFLKAILTEEPITKYGTGESYRDYTYIDDIVDGVIRSLFTYEKSCCRIFNLGNSNPVSLNEFISTCEDVCNKKAIIKQLPNQQGDVPKTYSDISYAKQELGYEPKTSLKEGLENTYNWLNKVINHID